MGLNTFDIILIIIWLIAIYYVIKGTREYKNDDKKN